MKKILIGLAASLLLASCEQTEQGSRDPVQLARFFAQQGTYSQAIPLLQSELKQNPQNQQSHILLAQMLFDLSHYPDAIKHYKRAIALGCEGGECYLPLIDALIAVKKNHQARDWLARATEDINPQQKRLRKIRIVYAEDEDAARLFRDLTGEDSMQANQIRLAVWFEQQRFDEMLGLQSRQTDFSSDALLLLAKAHFILKQYQQAEDLLMRLRQNEKVDLITPRKVEAVELLVKTKTALGKFSDADLVYRAFLKNHKSSHYAAFNRSLDNLRSHDFSAANKQISALLEANPSNQLATEVKAMALLGEKKYTRVIELLQPLAADQKWSPKNYTLLNLAQAYSSLNRSSEVINLLQNHHETDRLKLLLARAYLQNNNHTKAYQTLGKINPSRVNVLIKEQLAKLWYAIGDDQKVIQQFSKQTELTTLTRMLVINSLVRTDQLKQAKAFASAQQKGLRQRLLVHYAIQSKNVMLAEKLLKESIDAGLEKYRIHKNEDLKHNYALLAGLYFEQQSYAKAIATFQQGFEQKGDNRLLLKLAARLLAEPKMSDLIAWLDERSKQISQASLSKELAGFDEHKEINILLASHELKHAELPSARERLEPFLQDADHRILYLLALAQPAAKLSRAVDLMQQSLQIQFTTQASTSLLTYYQQQQNHAKLAQLSDAILDQIGITQMTVISLLNASRSLQNWPLTQRIADYFQHSGFAKKATELRGDISLKQKNYADAEVHYARLVQHNVKQPLLIKYFKAQFGATSEKSITLKKAEVWIKQQPDFYQFRLFIANVYLDLGLDKSATLRHFELLHQQFPDSISILNNYAWINLEQNPMLALSLSSQAFQQQPKSVEVADTHIVALKRNGQINAAKTLARLLIKTHPGHASLAKHLR